MAGVTPSLISQIENDKANPSLSTLMALAKSLNTEVVSFFDGKPAKSSSPVVRSTERVRLNSADDWATYLLTNKNFDMFSANISTIKPGADSIRYPEMHPKNLTTGHEFGFVLSGKIEITLENEIYVLNVGDSICFEAQKQHRITNSSNSDALVIWVNTTYPIDKPADRIPKSRHD
ncbi:HTH-type transcriptional regulator PuuR [bioreactor metagenome]|uniref:HTH-type transcriptional regulator PuuR n=1 Tax=bioreactor metagenome TaxID=1076179 RepID=A0A645GIF8_9ZZZZ